MKPALLVIDIQNEYLPLMSGGDRDMALRMINGAIWLFRQKNLPVIRVYHTNPDYGPEPGTEAFEFPKTVIIKETDPKVIKNYPNAFKKTELDKLLREKGVNTVFICGLSATGCVLATYYGANELDYHTVMVKNAVMSPNEKHTEAVMSFCSTVDFETLNMILSYLP